MVKPKKTTGLSGYPRKAKKKTTTSTKRSTAKAKPVNKNLPIKTVKLL
jgi:hypothetical protein